MHSHVDKQKPYKWALRYMLQNLKKSHTIEMAKNINFNSVSVSSVWRTILVTLVGSIMPRS